MSKNVWAIIGKNMHSHKSNLLAYIGLVVSFIGIWLVNIEITVTTKTLLSTILILIIIIYFLFVSLGDTIENYSSLPKLAHTKKIKEEYLILLCKPTVMIGHESLVTIYYLENGYEEHIATGFVLNIQENKFIQIKVLYEQCNKEIFKKLLTNAEEERTKVLIKPTISKSFIGGINEF
jgi:hypothetical protein